MDILSYLTELIKTRKEVGISGLGTLYKRKSPGRYDVETHSFLPPSYILDFTNEIREDKLLIAYVGKKRNISAEASTYYIDQFVEETIKQLSENREVDLGEIGTLSGDPQILTFVPKNQLNLGFDFYGLPSLKEESAAENEYKSEIVNENNPENKTDEQNPSSEERPLISEEQLELEDNNADLGDGSEEKAVEEIAHDDQPVYEEISEIRLTQKLAAPISIETQEDINSNEDASEDVVIRKPSNTPPFFNTPSPLDQPLTEPIETEEEASGLPLYVKIIISFAVILAIGVIVYFIKPELFNDVLNKSDNRRDNSDLIKKNDQMKIDSIAYADSVRISNEKAIQIIDSAKDSSVVNPATPQTGATVDTTGAATWEVIGASVINQKEAAKFIAQMKAIGITAKVVPNMPGKRRLKISIATFKDEESAKEGRKLLVTKLKDPGIYIHQNKHTHKPQ